MPERTEREKQVLEIARAQWAEEASGDDASLQFDADARVSEGDENGAYVQAWVWVTFRGTLLDKDPLGEEDEP